MFAYEYQMHEDCLDKWLTLAEIDMEFHSGEAGPS
jgi:hypothetical protein